MAEKHILIDTSILIEYYRKTDKLNSKWLALIRSGYDFSVSAKINAQLKRKRKQIDIADLFIAAAAL